jgi:Tfp pilus assembly protein PilE
MRVRAGFTLFEHLAVTSVGGLVAATAMPCLSNSPAHSDVRATWLAFGERILSGMKSRPGFTIAEVIIALALTAVIGMVLSSIFITQSHRLSASSAPHAACTNAVFHQFSNGGVLRTATAAPHADSPTVVGTSALAYQVIPCEFRASGDVPGNFALVSGTTEGFMGGRRLQPMTTSVFFSNRR